MANLYRAMGGEHPEIVPDRDMLAIWRGIEDPCATCGGSGVRTYANTATWRRAGLAGQALTADVCDKCWGSGDTGRTWTDLRKTEQRIKALENALLCALHGWETDTIRPTKPETFARCRAVLEGRAG